MIKKIFFSLLIIALPVMSYAGVDTSVNAESVAHANKPLVDCRTVDECSYQHFLDVLNKVKDYAFQIVVILSVIFIVWAGALFLFSQGNPGQIEKAKKMLSDVVIGFFLAAAGWLIVSAILNTLGVTNTNLAPADLINNKSI